MEVSGKLRELVALPRPLVGDEARRSLWNAAQPDPCSCDCTCHRGSRVHVSAHRDRGAYRVPIVIGPFAFALEQNYPNPFNPTTLIQYQLQAVSDVELTIYNQLGQEVRTLVKELQPSGAYWVEWNGQDNSGKPVVSGVYLYRLTAGRFVETRKLTLLK